MANEPITEVSIAGVATNSDFGWTAATLNLPIEHESDMLLSFVETVADKLGNDSEHDIYNYLSTWKVFDDLSAGAWQKFHHADEKKYFEPVFTAGTSTPLAWTLDPDAPLLPGAPFYDQTSANYSFFDYESFKGKLFAIDTRNWRVWRRNSNTWEYYAGAGTGWTSTPLGGSITNVTNPAGTTHRVATGATLPAVNDLVTIQNVGGATSANSTAASPVWTVTAVGAGYFEFDPTIALAGAYTSGGTWKADAAGLLAEPTELINIQQNGTNYLYVGQGGSGYARRSSNADTTPTWANYSTINARHFALVDEDLYYANGAIVTNSTTTTQWKVGDQNTNVNRLEWWSNYVIITKPEGVWVLLPTQDSLQRIAWFRTRSSDNGKVLLIHNSNAYWNAEESWYKWDGFNDPEQVIGKFDGNDNQLFYRGKVRAAFSDGQNLFFIWRVTTSDASPYYNDFVVIQSGETLGYHPVYVATSTTSEPSYYVGGIFLTGNKLFFSCGTASNSVTGYLATNGKIPISETNLPYTWGVGIITGWMDMGREHLAKWVKEVKVSTRDVSGTGTGNLTLSYQRWSDSAYTAFPSTLTGTNDIATLTPTAATESAAALQAGFTGNKVRFKLVLNNTGTSTQKEKMFYVRSFHVVGRIKYPFARQLALRVSLNYQEREANRGNRRRYTASEVYAGLLSLMAQTAPVTVTVNGESYLMTSLPNAGGVPYLEANTSTGRAGRRYFNISLREEK